MFLYSSLSSPYYKTWFIYPGALAVRNALGKATLAVAVPTVLKKSRLFKGGTKDAPLFFGTVSVRLSALNF